MGTAHKRSVKFVILRKLYFLYIALKQENLDFMLLILIINFKQETLRVAKIAMICSTLASL